MEYQTKIGGKEIVHEMLDKLGLRYRDVEEGRIELYHPLVCDVTLFYEDVDKYDTLYVRYEMMLTDLIGDDFPSENVMLSNICKAKFSSCQYAGHYYAVIHDVLIPAYSPRRDEIFKRELNRLKEAERNVRHFLEANALHLVEQRYCELVSDILNV